MVKIGGVVRILNQVRGKLQTGLRPDEVDDFRNVVRNAVHDIERICAKARQTPRALPGPSRMAYEFLKSLDLSNLPIIDIDKVGEDGLPPPPSTVRVSNVVAIADDTARQLWHKRRILLDSSTARSELMAELSKHTATIREVCRKHRQTPAALEPRSRQGYTYLQYLTEEKNLVPVLTALRSAGQLADGLYQSSNRPLELQLIGMNSLWRLREFANCRILKVHIGLTNASHTIWTALLTDALTARSPAKSNSSRQIVTEFTTTEDFSDVLFEIESLAAPPAPITRGRAHDLDESFTRVNRAYFKGQMARPALTWNQTLTASKFGHYKQAGDTIMISVSLDSPDVSTMLLDYVMYHELLHKKHGSTIINGRRLAHTPAFRDDERRFEGWEKAELELTRLAHRQATGRPARF